ncbi:hypothetical protein CEXT_305111 [Caerostris extrusa]|uniref:Uncharacterized protein n=1 Tax=Caerostris extrusa TaxID=172846 RepID=A0AAV4NX34_CAEEX|nr:hypothetical protein CEXT_305111 [Caerostris extrusa]
MVFIGKFYNAVCFAGKVNVDHKCRMTTSVLYYHFYDPNGFDIPNLSENCLQLIHLLNFCAWAKVKRTHPFTSTHNDGR